jgi:hypothetical protein
MPISDEVWQRIKSSCNPTPRYNKVLVRLVAQLGNYIQFVSNAGFPKLLEGQVKDMGAHTANLVNLIGTNLEYMTMVVDRGVAPLLIVKLDSLPGFWQPTGHSEISLEASINTMYGTLIPRVKWSDPSNPAKSIPLLFINHVPRGVLYLHGETVYDQFGFRVMPTNHLSINLIDNTWWGDGGPWIPYEHGLPFQSSGDFDALVRWNSIYFVAESHTTSSNDNIIKSLLGHVQEHTSRTPSNINNEVISDILFSSIYATTNNGMSGFKNRIYLVYNKESMSLSILRLTKR